MNNFLVVLKYELKEYFTSKSFVIVTLLLAVLGAGALFLPRVLDMSDITGVTKEVSKEVSKEAGEDSDNKEEKVTDPEDLITYYLYDKSGIVKTEVLEQAFEDSEWKMVKSEDDVKKAVKDEKAEAGFVVNSSTSYDYYIYNKSMYNDDSEIFSQAMKVFYQIDYCNKNNIAYDKFQEMTNTDVEVNEEILGKDTEDNFWYCYMLVILVFFLIIFYGQMIAVSVTTEKSNRAIEVLVTSTSPNSLLFGKVIAGAVGGIVQIGIVLGAILGSYRINREFWGGMLDMVFNIPGEVLVTFALFGLGGYLFYAFLYGAMGALVSKVEDVSKSSGGLVFIIMIVYMFSLAELGNVDSIVVKVLSFLPISSYSTMFARIAMGSVATWEIIVSFIILVISIICAGMIGAALYRMGTLRYGNPIKLKTAIKSIKQNK